MSEKEYLRKYIEKRVRFFQGDTGELSSLAEKACDGKIIAELLDILDAFDGQSPSRAEGSKFTWESLE